MKTVTVAEREVWAARRNEQAAWERTQSANATVADVKAWVVARAANAAVQARCA